MKKILATLLLLAAMLVNAGCEGDLEHKNVTITDKFIVSGGSPSLMVKFNEGGKEFIYRVPTTEYNEATVGSKVNVYYNSFKATAEIKPAE